MARIALALVAAVLFTACGASPAQPSEQAIQTAIAATAVAQPMREATAYAEIDQALADDPAPVWKDKLSGQWLDTSKQNRTVWLIDLDGGSIGFDMGGAGSSAKLSFDHEEGKTVYVTITGKAATRTDSFRFLDDDTVIWTNTASEEEITLKRQ